MDSLTIYLDVLIWTHWQYNWVDSYGHIWTHIDSYGLIKTHCQWTHTHLGGLIWTPWQWTGLSGSLVALWIVKVILNCVTHTYQHWLSNTKLWTLSSSHDIGETLFLLQKLSYRLQLKSQEFTITIKCIIYYVIRRWCTCVERCVSLTYLLEWNHLYTLFFCIARPKTKNSRW